MSGALTRRRLALLLCAVVCSAGAWLGAADAARAAIDDETSQGPVEGPCALSIYSFNLQLSYAVVGVPLAGSTVQVNAAASKLAATKATATRACEPLFFQIPAYQWSILEVPPGQSASLSATTTLSPSILIGAPGVYRVRLTACPNRCRVTFGGQSRMVGPFTAAATVEAMSTVPVPPETEPIVPPLSGPQPPIPRFSKGQRFAMCLGRGGINFPEWVTVAEPRLPVSLGEFRGPGDYRLVEGPVTWSRVADLDNFLNHDSQDFEWKVQPDPPYVGLTHPDPNAELKTEWEMNSLPQVFQPTPGDRAASVGFWIFDCGHDPFKAEIHPPVGVAVERPRPVQIPASFRAPGFPNGFGSNVQVPGIVTDIWFNRRSGETTRNCSATGLHQPPRLLPRLRPGPCIREPHSLSRSFTFNVYLPRNPQQRAQEIGLNAPPVPLFVGAPERFTRGQGGPEPRVVVRQSGGVTWLEVTVDLTGFRGDQYARRISTAWAYPNPDNWGASRWRVLLRNMRIFDDLDPLPFDDGDWRFFFNTNNRDLEWSTVFSCDGCIESNTTRNLNLSTGPPGGNRKLGPDPVVFRDIGHPDPADRSAQTILVHTTGYDDEVVGDNAGSVVRPVPPRSGNYTFPSDNGAYQLVVEVRPGPLVGRAALTPEASALSAAYTGRSGSQCTATAAPTAAQVGPPRANVCGAAARDPILAGSWDPANLILNRAVVGAGSLAPFEANEREEFTVQGISMAALRREVNSMSASDRRRLFDEIRQDLNAVPARRRSEYAEFVKTLDLALSDTLVRRALPRVFLPRALR